MSATSSGDAVSEVMTQVTPTLCIQVPTLDAIAAIQIERKTAWWRGLQAEALGPVPLDGAPGDWGLLTSITGISLLFCQEYPWRVWSPTHLCCTIENLF